jgi:uncharacterized membrane protein
MNQGTEMEEVERTCRRIVVLLAVVGMVAVPVLGMLVVRLLRSIDCTSEQAVVSGFAVMVAGVAGAMVLLYATMTALAVLIVRHSVRRLSVDELELLIVRVEGMGIPLVRRFVRHAERSGGATRAQEQGERKE